MKKIYWSFLTVFSLLILASCSEDKESVERGDGGSLKFKIDFAKTDGSKYKAADTNIRPVTSWASIQQAQMFLYDATSGEIQYSYVIYPSASNLEFTWNNIPVGNYELVLVANANSANQSIFTTLDGTTNEAWTDFNVREKKINTEAFLDLKSGTFPQSYAGWVQGVNSAYQPASEIFTAYASNINIQEGVPFILSQKLELEREVSMFRLRVNRQPLDDILTGEGNASQISNVKFDSDSAMFLIQRNPVGMGFKLNTFQGGIFDTASDKSRVIVAGNGSSNLRTDANPSGYESFSGAATPMISGDYTMWKDVVVFPNAARSEGLSASDEADVSRKYYIILSAEVPNGYVLDDGTVVAGPRTVYWDGMVSGVFAPNEIREVNITIRSKGKLEPPVEPSQLGSLTIELEAPLPWAAIEGEEIEV